MASRVRLGPLGDAAIVVELGEAIDPRINARVHALDWAVGEARLPGVRECVPAYASLAVHYDPLEATCEELLDALRPLVAALPVEPSPPDAGAVVEVPVAYGGEAGPDLPDVARHARLSEEEVARRHATGDYRVAMVGFAPGFPYLMGMDPALACPRLGTPRVRVPAGSVGIADAQTGIYPFAMPGGWRLIGRTALRLFDPLRDPPALLAPGARVRFVPVEGDGRTAGAHLDEEAPPGRPAGAGPFTGRAMRVLEPGLLTTVQDGGRFGLQRFGVPPSGAADRRSLAAGNAAIGEAPGTAGLEITAGEAQVEFLAPATFSLAGAPRHARLGDRPVRLGEPVAAGTREVLRLGRPLRGLRTYLCVRGGIAVPAVLGSRSTYLPAAIGGFGGRRLQEGDIVPFGGAPGAPPVVPGDVSGPDQDSEAARAPSPGPMPGGAVLDVPFIPASWWDRSAEELRRAFLARTWLVSHRSDRIGLRLEGEPPGRGPTSGPFVTDPTVTGAIQLAGDGTPIVLLVDRQTTGGYPKLGAVASVGLDLLGQAQPGDAIRFHAIGVAEAQAAWRRRHGGPHGPGH